MRLYIILLLFIVGCSVLPASVRKTDNTFDPYLSDFVRQSKGAFTRKTLDESVIVEFHDYPEDSSVVGTCYYKSIGKNQIHINREWWFRSYISEYERLEVVFHELGHCVLYRGHTAPPEEDQKGFYRWVERWLFKLGFYTPKGYLKDGCPSSIMHPYTLWDICIVKHYDYYMDELFGRQ